MPSSSAHGALFGKGIYMTSTSSKSHVYNRSSEDGLGKGRRQMFVVLATLGRMHKAPTADPSLPATMGAGCDSVLGLQGASDDDEAIVYRPDAAIPRYMIIYKY